MRGKMSEAHEAFALKFYGFSRILMRRWRDADRETGLGPAQFFVLSALSRAQSPLSLGVLAERERVTGATMSRIVASLESAGAVTRTTGADRRVSLIAATPQGIALYEKVQRRRLEMIQAFTNDLKPETLDDLSHALDRLLMRAEGVTPPGGGDGQAFPRRRSR